MGACEGSFGVCMCRVDWLWASRFVAYFAVIYAGKFVVSLQFLWFRVSVSVWVRSLPVAAGIRGQPPVCLCPGNTSRST